MFTEYDEIEEIYTTTKLGYSFTRKSQERFKFDAKDILNIRSEINTNIEDGKKVFTFITKIMKLIILRHNFIPTSLPY